VNTELANQIRDQIRAAPQQIQVRCPRRHFIADTDLDVPYPGAPIRMHFRGSARHYGSDRKNQKAGAYGVREYIHSASGSHIVRLQCPKCPYDGKFRYSTLAVKLAVYALEGRTEYCLET
jgi:hypothetical protein